MADQDHSVVAMPHAYLTDNPLDPVLIRLRNTLEKRADNAIPTEVTRENYIDLIDGVVEYFHHFQAENGRIIDPFLHREYQYSTPTYALAAAVLVSSGKRPDLLTSASLALDSSLFQLASGTANDRHGDFFILPTMLAYRHLRDRVDAATRNRWDRYLGMLIPEFAYSDLIGDRQANVINWNTSAISGEFLRHKDGFTDLHFVDKYLDAQLPHFTPEGLYREPGSPLVYDTSARFNFSVLLEEGYTGKQRKALEVLLERGAWASLLMQSPSGDFPTGGRSAEHVWNDALNCASFELWARRSHAAGDEIAARAFKRAAHLAAQVVSRWVRPSGELWIVKNRFDPALRHGFEEYSSHSQYNLLAAAYMAMAWSMADDRISEGVSPADVGGFVVDLPEFHKVFANSGGHYLEIETAADPHYNGTGLLRVHRRGMDNQLGESDSPPSQGSSPAVGISWRSKGRWESLAEYSVGKVSARTFVIDASPEMVRFDERYQLKSASIESVTESYSLTPSSVTITVQLKGQVDQWKVRFPAFAFDGREIGKIDLNRSGVAVHSASSIQRFELLGPGHPKLHQTSHIVSMRSGYYMLIEGEGRGKRITYSLGAK
ncbi:hypothetical protein [Paraburkholderia sp.]|uniref:hypothetical protein n=1 Tax=Paraburkholderia sp. TaxID=1926495 RepID=UPI003C79B824